MIEPFLGSRAYVLERDFACLAATITDNGIPFDVPAAQALLSVLDERQRDLADDMQRLLPPALIRTPFTPKRNNARKNYQAGVTIYKQHYEPFNPGSPKQVAERLMALGWQPTVFTESGNPSTRADVLASLTYPEAQAIAAFKICSKRQTMLAGEKGWLNIVGDDGRIHTSYQTLGTVTGRCSHSPNIAQVPRVRKDAQKQILRGVDGAWGYECRNLFYAPGDWYLIDSDMSGLELRCLAHYLAPWDGGEYARIVSEQDPHAVNASLIGDITRDQSKTFVYACVPMDTQALTKRGWIGYAELQVGELVLTYNANTRCKEWQPVLEKVYYPEADVVELKNDQGFSVRCTPNHRWFTTKRTWPRSHHIDRVRDWQHQIVETTDLTTEHNIIMNAPMAPCHGEPQLSPWQDGPKYGQNWVQRVLEMSNAERSAWLCGFCLADGHWMQNGQWTWSQNVGEIAEAAILASYLTWDGRISLTPRHTCPSPMIVGRQVFRNYVTCKRIKKVAHPKQPVWCIRTANESWVMRQGNTITITGNTIYGGGDHRLGTIIEPDEGDDYTIRSIGRAAKEALISGITGFKELFRWLDSGNDPSHIEGLDHRALFVRKPHAKLNTLLQAAGAILCKQWALLTDAELQRLGLHHGQDYQMLASIHDEIILAGRTREIAETIAAVCVAKAQAAGEFYDLQCPLAAESHIGFRWGDVH